MADENAPAPAPAQPTAPTRAERLAERRENRVSTRGRRWEPGVARARTLSARRAAARMYAHDPNMSEVAAKAFIEGAVKQRDPDVAGLDIQTMLLIATLIYKFYQLWQANKAKASDLGAVLLDGEPSFDPEPEEGLYGPTGLEN